MLVVCSDDHHVRPFFSREELGHSSKAIHFINLFISVQVKRSRIGFRSPLILGHAPRNMVQYLEGIQS